MAGASGYNGWLLERARPFLGEHVLDAGAGIGTFTSLLVAEGRAVVAPETDPVRGAAAKPLRGQRRRRRGGRDERRPGQPLRLGRLLQRARAHPDHVAALERFRAVLRPGGSLLLLVPAHPALYGEIDRIVGHERRYTVNGLRRLLEQAAFAPELVRYVNLWERSAGSSRPASRRLRPSRRAHYACTTGWCPCPGARPSPPAVRTVGLARRAARSMRVSFIVPAYNEARTIRQVLERIDTLDVDAQVVVVGRRLDRWNRRTRRGVESRA